MDPLPALAASGTSIMPFALLGTVVVFFGVLAVIGIFVVVVVANRADPDPAGRRPLTVYCFGVSFFSVFAILFGSFGIVASLVQLIGGHAGIGTGAIHPVGDAVARSVAISSIITLIGTALVYVHLPRGLALSDGADSRRGPAGRVAQSYVVSVAFVSVLIAAVATVAVVYQLIRILGPGVFLLSGSRADATRPLIAGLFLAVAAAILAITHLGLLPPDVRLIRPFSPTPGPGTAWPGGPVGPGPGSAPQPVPPPGPLSASPGVAPDRPSAPEPPPAWTDG